MTQKNRSFYFDVGLLLGLVGVLLDGRTNRNVVAVGDGLFDRRIDPGATKKNEIEINEIYEIENLRFCVVPFCIICVDPVC